MAMIQLHVLAIMFMGASSMRNSDSSSLSADVSILKCPEICYSDHSETSPESACSPAWTSVIGRFARALLDKEERGKVLEQSRAGIRNFCELCRPPRANARTKKCRPPALDKALDVMVKHVRLTRTQSRGVTEDPSISALEAPPEELDVVFDVVEPGAFVEIRSEDAKSDDGFPTGIVERAVPPTSKGKWTVRIVEGKGRGGPGDRIVFHENDLTIIPPTAEVQEQRMEEAGVINDVLEICEKKETKLARDQCCMKQCFEDYVTEHGYHVRVSCISSCTGLKRTKWSVVKAAIKATAQ